MRHLLRLFGFGLGALAISCGGGGTPDAATDGFGLPDGFELYACKTPGQACNAHDLCAISPICGADGFCRPQGMQTCDDGLECTEDRCLGQGKCDFVAKDGACALVAKGKDGKSVVTCFKKGDRDEPNSCRECDPQKSKSKWSPASGGACDDGQSCTKDDYCDNGACKGTNFADQCSDKYGCTEDLCDGKGGCKGNPLKKNSCLINGACYRDGDKDAQGCNVCDIKKSQSAWTPLSVHCLIGGTCYKPQEKDKTQCQICDPAKDKNAWTPIAGLCKIDNKCYKTKDKNQGGCAECDPAVSSTAWTVKGNDCYIDSACKKAADKDATGCAQCDPASDKYGWSVVANTCLINGKCYQPGNKDSTSCGECKPASSATTWTVGGNVCLISGKCLQPKTADTLGCADCDPSKSKLAFTPLSGKCRIGQRCYADGFKDPSGCLTCKASAAAKSWSPLGTAALKAFDFEDGKLTGWTVTNSDKKVGWVVANRRAANGSYALYYGDPALGDYDTFFDNNGKAQSPSIRLAASKKAGLRFWIYMDTEDGDAFDTLQLFVVSGSTTTMVWEKSDVTLPLSKMKTWLEIGVDLSKYAGQTIKLEFAFDTVDEFDNTTEGAFIDDLTIFNGC